MFNRWVICATLFIFRLVHLLANEIQGYKRIDEYIPCDDGWSYFGGKCYKMFGGNMQAFGRLNWNDARERCKSLGGHITTVQSKEAQDFIFVYVLLVGEMVSWIGLNDLKNESQYEWVDGTEFNYSNWNELEPSGFAHENEDCVQMILDVYTGETGKWNDLDCSYPLAYICQVDKDKQSGRSRNPLLCSSEEGGGWKYEESCYNILKENMTWEHAEKYCQDKFKGHLLTMLNFKMDYFLNYVMQDFSTDIWIGIKMKDKFQQKFSSGWSVIYSNLSKTPRPFVNGTCVVRKRERTWEVVSCSEEYPFVCETSKVSPPVFDIPLEESKCPELPNDWRDLGGEYCYYIDTKSRVDWYQANFECNRRGGALASFHSQKEIDALAPYVKNELLINYAIFVGHFRRLGYDNVFVWADGSPMDFKYWSDGEPSNEDEQCGEIFAANMKWNDVKCGENKGYICSVKKATVKVTETEADDHCITGITFETFIGVTCFILLLVISLPVVIYCFSPWREEKKKKSAITDFPLKPPIQPPLQQKSHFDGRTEHFTANDCDDGYEFMD